MVPEPSKINLFNSGNNVVLTLGFVVSYVLWNIHIDGSALNYLLYNDIILLFVS